MGQRYDIDDAVARRDIQRINKAIPLLEESLKRIQQLQKSASGMKAETGNAIAIRSDDLIRSTRRLIQSLEKHNQQLEKVLKMYHATDHEAAARIYKGGGGGYSAGGGGRGSFGGGGGGAGSR